MFYVQRSISYFFISHLHSVLYQFSWGRKIKRTFACELYWLRLLNIQSLYKEFSQLLWFNSRWKMHSESFFWIANDFVVLNKAEKLLSCFFCVLDAAWCCSVIILGQLVKEGGKSVPASVHFRPKQNHQHWLLLLALFTIFRLMSNCVCL